MIGILGWITVTVCAVLFAALAVLLWALETPLDPEKQPPRSYPE